MRISLLPVAVFFLFSTSLLIAAKHPALKVTVSDEAIRPTAEIPIVSYADVIHEATDSVVSVYTSKIQSLPQQEMNDWREFFRRYHGRGSEEIEPRSREVTGLGSGVIISTDGYIITNNHVIRDQRGGAVDEIRVQLKDGKEYIAEVVGTDAKTDVAVIKIDTSRDLPAATIADSEKLKTGDVVFAIGSPLGQSQTVTQGIVSATKRRSLEILGPGSYENFIQTDAAINVGNSGGALIDAWGRLIGINTAIVSGSGGNIGLGYSIPINMALSVARDLIEIGEVPRGMLGLIPVDLTVDLAEAFGLASTDGALVNQVLEGSPAANAGIQHGDVILEVDGVIIDSAAQLRLTVSQMKPGSQVEVRLLRGEEEMTREVVLGSLTGKLYSDEPEVVTSVLKGVKLGELTDELRTQFQIPEDVDGVVVQDVDTDSPYRKQLAPGSVIMEVNGQRVLTPEAVSDALKDSGMSRFYVWLNGQPRFLGIRTDKE
ncbi:Do family serine endopeptidase [Coraliomargarita akajimensis]|uniref:Protease Do n=1 Tax=Coraliomargarita akajimensis (strain DSM 45221 / IAM 15411 / JCM 23193 / KCTC 12865 / 04OKA010-24) TaxID=583355 RepID=D5EJJ9_CORAD|nr:Do family serine endopeptidase [Coraliomargarita akajimensis]ADE54598.1 protease Do [Coraliomargarita akajimensis DSM 45221]